MAFPTTSVLDSGVGSDETELAGNWGNVNATIGGLARTSNQFTGVGGTFDASRWSATSFNPATGDGIEIFFTVATEDVRLGPNFYTLASGPPTDTPDGYEMDVNRATDLWRIKRVTAGVASAIGADVTQAIANGDGVGLVIRQSGADTILDAYFKSGAGAWGLLFSRTDTGFTTYNVAGDIGMYIQNSTARVTNFGGGQVVGGLTAAQMRPSFAQATENSNAMIGRVWD